MQASTATTHRQPVRCIIANLHIILPTFVMYPMVGHDSRRIKMPRLDAYIIRTNFQRVLVETFKRIRFISIIH